jgi:hypothetical protein
MEIIIKAEKRVHQFICCGIYNGNNVGVFMRLSSSAHSARFARQLFRKRKKKKEKVNFGTDKKNTVENLTQQTGGCSEEGHPICAAICNEEKSISFLGKRRLRLRGLERERGESG